DAVGGAAFQDAPRLLFAALAVLRVDELHDGPLECLALAVTEHRLDRRIDARPVTVEARDGDHLRSEREVPVDLPQGTPAPQGRQGKRADERGEGEPGSEDEPGIT